MSSARIEPPIQDQVRDAQVFVRLGRAWSVCRAGEVRFLGFWESRPDEPDVPFGQVYAGHSPE